MNFEHVVLKYYLENDRKFFKSHIVRAFNKAKGYSIDEFIERCLAVLKERKEACSFSLFNDVKPTSSDLELENPEIKYIGILNQSQIPIKYNDLPVMKVEILKAKKVLLAHKRTSEIGENVKKSVTPKLKTSLSVPQLALLFKMIDVLKPTIIKGESKEDLFRFISANFETKKSTEEGISTNKLRNLFSSPDSKALDFWEKHLRTMLSEIQKLKKIE